jgi:hypothetical protein
MTSEEIRNEQSVERLELRLKEAHVKKYERRLIKRKLVRMSERRENALDKNSSAEV